MAAVPSDPKKPKPAKKGLFRRILAFFKHAAEWVPENLGDPIVAQRIREDLGLPEDADVPADKQVEFKRFAAGLDVDQSSFLATVEQVKDLVPLLMSLKDDFANDRVDPLTLQYMLFRLMATDFVRLREPALYAVMRAVLFLEDDVESLALIDPAVMLHQLYGEDLPPGELLAQRLSGAGALILQLVNDLVLGHEEETNYIDIDYGWDASPGTVTPLADLVSTRTTTFRVGQKNTGAGLLVTLAYVPAEHGGPGMFMSFGGAVKLVREAPPHPQDVDPTDPQTTTSMRYALDAGFGSALSVFWKEGAGVKGLRVAGGLDTPFLKFTVASGAADLPEFRIGAADGTRLDV